MLLYFSDYGISPYNSFQSGSKCGPSFVEETRLLVLEFATVQILLLISSQYNLTCSSEPLISYKPIVRSRSLIKFSFSVILFYWGQREQGYFFLFYSCDTSIKKIFPDYLVFQGQMAHSSGMTNTRSVPLFTRLKIMTQLLVVLQCCCLFGFVFQSHCALEGLNKYDATDAQMISSFPSYSG